MLDDIEERGVLIMRRARGVSMVEVMVVVAILSIVMGVAVPSLRQWLANLQVRGKVEAVLNGLQLARGEALRRNTRVMFTIATDSSWTIGCETALATDTDGDGVADCPAQIQQKSSTEGGSGVTLTLTPANATRATFSGVGMVVTNANGTATLAQVDVASSSGGTRAYRILLTAGGQSRVCDPAVTDSAKPEKC